MFRFLPAAILLALSPVTASADLIHAYYATITDADRRNSGGSRLTAPGAVLQQDRANYHRFGIRQFADESDPFFGNRALRARIQDLYIRGRRDNWSDSVLVGDFDIDVLVFICGSAGQMTHINVEPADGDGHSGC